MLLWSAGLGTLTLGLILTVQTTYVFSELPGTPVFYKQFAEHLAWTSGNAGCAHSALVLTAQVLHTIRRQLITSVFNALHVLRSSPARG